MNEGQIAVVVGVGPGLGLSVAKACAAAGMKVAMSARSDDRLQAMKAEVAGDAVFAYPCDATDPAAVAELFQAIDKDSRDAGPGRLQRRRFRALTGRRDGA